MNLLTPREASQLYGVSTETLRGWCKDGRIDSVMTDGGHRRYKKIEERPAGDLLIAYARVPSEKMRPELSEQTEYFTKHYPHHKIISDIGSGLDGSREGFKWILEQVFTGKVKEIVVMSSDRFSRIYMELFEWMFNKFNTKFITVLEKTECSNEDVGLELLEAFNVLTAKPRKQKISKVVAELPVANAVAVVNTAVVANAVNTDTVVASITTEPTELKK